MSFSIIGSSSYPSRYYSSPACPRKRCHSKDDRLSKLKDKVKLLEDELQMEKTKNNKLENELELMRIKNAAQQSPYRPNTHFANNNNKHIL